MRRARRSPPMRRGAREPASTWARSAWQGSEAKVGGTPRQNIPRGWGSRTCVARGSNSKFGEPSCRLRSMHLFVFEDAARTPGIAGLREGAVLIRHPEGKQPHAEDVCGLAEDLHASSPETGGEARQSACLDAVVMRRVKIQSPREVRGSGVESGIGCFQRSSR